MPYAVGDLTVERRFRVIDADPRLEKRQDPESSTTAAEATPAETPTSTPAETTSSQPTSTTPVTSTTPIETSSAAPTSSSTPVASPSSTPVESSAEPTSAVPTDPAQSSAVASQSSVSTASAISTQSIASSTNAEVPTTRVITSFMTNGAGTVTVVFTSTSAVGPTASASNSGSSTNTGAIVGGVVGGVGGLLLLIALFWFIRRKTHKDQYEENMFAPDRNVDRGEMDLAGDDVHDPEAIARPYHLPASPTRNEMTMSASSRPLSAQSYGRPLSGQFDEAAAAGMSRPTSGMSSYTQPGSGMGMPMPMPMPIPMSRDHLAYAQSRTNSTHDHQAQTSEPTTSEGGSSSARLMKEREARRLHVANDDGGVIVHSDGGRVDEEAEDDAPREIPPTYESIGGSSGAR